MRWMTWRANFACPYWPHRPLPLSAKVAGSLWSLKRAARRGALPSSRGGSYIVGVAEGEDQKRELQREERGSRS